MRPEPQKFAVAIPRSWLYRASTFQLAWMAVALACLVSILLAVLEINVIRQNIGRNAIYVIDAAVSLAIGLLSLRVMLDRRRQLRSLVRRLETIAELNHHIRNALYTIQMSAYEARDAVELRQINEAVERVQWALREILPQQHDDEVSRELTSRPEGTSKL